MPPRRNETTTYIIPEKFMHTPESLAEIEARKEAHASAYLDMEESVYNLVRMANIADRAVCEAVAELRSDEPPDAHNVEIALFAVGHVSEMLERLVEKYYPDVAKERAQ